MRILFIGDVVGRSGRNVLLERLGGLIRDWKLDFVAVNGENAAGGFGITEAIYHEFVDAGVDVITGGNHSWDQREALVFIERAPKLLRPINFPPGTPGRGVALIDAKNGARVLVVNVMGRVFMDALDDPFAAVEGEQRHDQDIGIDFRGVSHRLADPPDAGGERPAEGPASHDQRLALAVDDGQCELRARRRELAQQR